MLIISYGMHSKNESKVIEFCGAFDSLIDFERFERHETVWRGNVITYRRVLQEMPMSVDEWRKLHSC